MSTKLYRKHVIRDIQAITFLAMCQILKVYGTQLHLPLSIKLWRFIRRKIMQIVKAPGPWTFCLFKLQHGDGTKLYRAAFRPANISCWPFALFDLLNDCSQVTVARWTKRKIGAFAIAKKDGGPAYSVFLITSKCPISPIAWAIRGSIGSIWRHKFAVWIIGLIRKPNYLGHMFIL